MKAIFDKFRPASSIAALVVCAAWLAGCASDPADVEDRSIDESPSLQSPQPARVKAPPPGGSYRVIKGDTLYSIAFRRGLDYRDVAAWNGIAAPEYKILVGQELRFSPPGTQAAETVRSAAMPATAQMTAAQPSTPAVAPAPAAAPAKDTGMFEDVPNQPAPAASAQAQSSVPAAAPISTASPPPASASPAASPAPTPIAVATPPAVAAKAPAEAAPSPPRPANESAASNVGGIAWRWPSTGKVIGTYIAGDQTKQGVDIAGAAGDPVLASADGEVVYSGNGLLGYGELVIVKHNASFLSAYGHNRKRMVAEGDKVRAGQQIAEMGSSASSRDQLHFEIRKNGKPVNPLDYLPAR